MASDFEDLYRTHRAEAVQLAWLLTHDSGVAEDVAWTVEGLPGDVAFVSYTDGDKHLWQRPIASFAAFPDVEGMNEVVIAYDSSGGELGRYGAAEVQASAFVGDMPQQADISQVQFEELAGLTRDELSACLARNGGTVGVGDVATFAIDVDQVAVWNDCVTSVEQVVADRVTEIHPRFFDPATERPTDPNSPFGSGD